jgi:hypothetical protein
MIVDSQTGMVISMGLREKMIYREREDMIMQKGLMLAKAIIFHLFLSSRFLSTPAVVLYDARRSSLV